MPISGIYHPETKKNEPKIIPRLRPRVFSYAIIAAPPSEAADNQDYLKGYTQAILDVEFGAKTIRVVEVDAHKLITQTSDKCVSTEFRERIQQRVASQNIAASVTGPVRWTAKGIRRRSFR